MVTLCSCNTNTA